MHYRVYGRLCKQPTVSRRPMNSQRLRYRKKNSFESNFTPAADLWFMLFSSIIFTYILVLYFMLAVAHSARHPLSLPSYFLAPFPWQILMIFDLTYTNISKKVYDNFDNFHKIFFCFESKQVLPLKV